jgi:SNF2 family DNA or RNA helicase
MKKMSAARQMALYAKDPAAFALTGLEPPPVRLFDIEALELIHGPPPVILGYKDFRPYQKWMASTAIELPAVYLGAEMGLGKTGASLYAIRKLHDAGTIRRALVVAPIKVADETWPEEIAKWDFARDLEYAVLTGDENERRIAARQDVPIHIINRENLVWLHWFWGARWPYDMLVYDEASRLQEASAKTSPTKRADGSESTPRISGFGVLKRRRRKFKRVILLSGTPAPRGMLSLWGPIYIIDGGHRLLTSKTAFKNRWFIEDRYTYEVEPRIGAEQEIMERLQDVFYTLKEEDYLTLPPRQFVDHMVTLPPKAMEMYRRLEKTMVLDEFDLEAVNSGVLTNKLLQLANGSLYLPDGSAQFVHDEKLKVLDSIMQEASGRPVLLGYEFQFDKAAIRKKFPYARFFGEHKSDKRDWDAGKIKLLVTHPASAGHGLNLQFGGNIQVWFGLTWSLELYLQFIKRLHRSGQLADRVFIHRILARRTVDEAMVGRLDIKGATQSQIMRAVKANVASHLRLAA